jgi:hypothetical protein
MHPHIDVFTAQAVSGLKYASRLASRTGQRTIRGDDIFFGICNLIKHHDLLDVFQSVMGLPHTELCTGKMEEKYRLEGDTIHFMEEKKLNLGKKLSNRIQHLLNDPTKTGKAAPTTLDISILFYTSFCDLSTPCAEHLRKA